MRIGDLDALKEDLKQYFSDGILDSVSAKLAFNMILRKIDNAPTVEPEPYFEKAEKDKRIYERGFEDGQNARPQGEAECMEEDAKQASIPYTYSSPQHDWKCGYPDSPGGKKD